MRMVDWRVLLSTRVKFEVFDKDRLSNDLIGTIVVTLPNKPGSYGARGGAVTTLAYQLR